MIDWPVLGAFTLLWLVFVPTPGANSLMVTHVALTRGWRHVAAAVAGNMVGIVLLGLLARAGMAVVLQAFPWMRLVVHIVGGVYLVFFGARLLYRGLSAGAATLTDRSAMGVDTPLAKAFILGLATQLSNAQAIVFIISIFAAAGVLTASLATGIGCVVAMVVANAIYLGLLGAMFQLPVPRRLYLAFRHRIETVMGGLFVAFGLRLVVKELSGR